ncbi:MAG: asparaginase domain-containing protein [Patescibacteria group bacterium]
MIKFLITGGTIDDLEYQSLKDEPKYHNSLIPEVLKKNHPDLDYVVDIIMQKDSKFFAEKDRQLVARKCLEAKEDKIIITHGTATMVKTAEYLGNQRINKTIVLVGAFIPVNKEGTDALLNLKTAIKGAQKLTNGVYVAMNGQIFNWNNVRKNPEKRVFETIK